MFYNPGLDPSDTVSPVAGIASSAAAPDVPMPTGQPVVNEDGTVDFPDAVGPQALTEVAHDANLAEAMDETALGRIAEDLLEGIDADWDSNAGMREIFARGLDYMIVPAGKKIDLPFVGACGVVHPAMLEAVIRGQANARGEMLPAAGPVRTLVLGDETPDAEARAGRKKDWLNYWLTQKDEDYVPDFDQMLLLIWFYGSMFRKVYRDPMRRGMPVSRSLSPEDLLVSYAATSLHGSGRVTHIERNVSPADLIKLQLKGWYRAIDLNTPLGDDERDDTLGTRTEGRERSSRQEDAVYKLYHCHCLLDLDGLEHLDADGEPSGLPMPYIVTIEPESRRVLRVARNWNEGDDEFAPREYYVHFKYMPGFGFYGWGLVHLMGSSVDALTTMRRQAINTITLKTFPGGLRTKGATKPEQSRIAPGPGEFVEINTNGMPIRDAIMPLPYADLPPSFAPVMQELLEATQRLGGIGDMAVGEGREDALPGTVIAMIEQATKVESAVMKRMHAAQRKELRLMADLFGADQEARYPYVVGGKRGVAVAADFQDNEDIVPVSDPNIPTQSQRLAQADATLKIAQASNGIVDVHAATEDFFRIMGRSDQEIARLMPPPGQGQPADPVTEFAAVLKGSPLVAGPTQDHAAHIQAHMAQMAMPGLDKLPAYQHLIAHMADHAGLFYAGEASRVTGIPITPGQVSPQQQAQITQAVAAMSDQLRVSLLRLAPPPAGDPLAQAKLELDRDKLDVTRQQIILNAHEQSRKATQDVADRNADMTKLAATLADNEKQRQTETLVNQQETDRSILSLRTAQVSAAADVTKQQIDRDTTIGEQLIDHASVAKRADADVTVAEHHERGEKHKASAIKAKKEHP